MEACTVCSDKNNNEETEKIIKGLLDAKNEKCKKLLQLLGSIEIMDKAIRDVYEDALINIEYVREWEQLQKTFLKRIKRLAKEMVVYSHLEKG